MCRSMKQSVIPLLFVAYVFLCREVKMVFKIQKRKKIEGEGAKELNYLFFVVTIPNIRTNASLSSKINKSFTFIITVVCDIQDFAL